MPIYLRAAEVHLWLVRWQTSGLPPAQLEPLLSPEEKSRLAGLRQEADRHRFMAGHAILRLLLAAYLGNDPRRLPLAHDVHGKPGLLDADAAEPLEFNLSHSRDLVLIAVGRGIRLGVDIEYHRAGGFSESMLRSVLTEAEHTFLQRADAESRGAVFYQLWVRKEALAKAMGLGLALPFGKVDVSAPLCRPGPFLVGPIPAPAPLPRSWMVQDLEAPPDYAAALAFDRRGVRLRVLEFSPRVLAMVRPGIPDAIPLEPSRSLGQG